MSESVASRYDRDYGKLKAAEAAEDGDQFEPTRFARTRTHIPAERAEREYVEDGSTVIPEADYGQPVPAE